MPGLALVEGLRYEPGVTPRGEPGSFMRAGSHLFLRHRLTESARHPGGPA